MSKYNLYKLGKCQKIDDRLRKETERILRQDNNGKNEKVLINCKETECICFSKRDSPIFQLHINIKQVCVIVTNYSVAFIIVWTGYNCHFIVGLYWLSSGQYPRFAPFYYVCSNKWYIVRRKGEREFHFFFKPSFATKIKTSLKKMGQRNYSLTRISHFLACSKTN